MRIFYKTTMSILNDIIQLAAEQDRNVDRIELNPREWHEFACAMMTHHQLCSRAKPVQYRGVWIQKESK